MIRKFAVLVVAISLSLAAMACSLAQSGQAAPERQLSPTAFAAAIVGESPTAANSFVVPTVTPSPDPTLPPVADNATDDDLGILGGDNGASMPESANDSGEAIAVESLSSIQDVAAEFYVPGCTPALSWPLYTVVGGDTLYKIATRYDTSWQALAQANCLANPSLIYVGQALHVPLTPASPPDGNPGSLPVIANPPQPSPTGCNVFVKEMSRLVPVFEGPDITSKVIAHLYNYARWLETTGNGHRIAFPFGGSGWVMHQDAYVAGNCDSGLPVYDNPGDPPLSSCSVVPAADSGWITWIYTAPGGRGDVVGRLGNFAPVVQYADGSFEIALRGWNVVGWVKETDVGLVGTCPDFYAPTPTHTATPPSPTWTPVPPTPTHTATPSPPHSNLPHISNPGRPAPDACVVRVKSNAPVLIYPGPISIGPIAVLDNFAPYIDSVEAGYIIALTDQRTGWVSERDTDLEGQCFSTTSTNVE